MEQKPLKKIPLGTLILGGVNCCIFGALFLLSSLVVQIQASPEYFEQFVKVLQEAGLSTEITFEQFMSCNKITMGFALFFLLSGRGLILRREWARKSTVYFSLTIVALILFLTISAPFVARLMLPHVVYLGILIMYFTNSNIKSYYNLKTQGLTEE